MTLDDLNIWQVIFDVIKGTDSNMTPVLLKIMIIRLKSAKRMYNND